MHYSKQIIEDLQRIAISSPPDERGRFGPYGGRFVPETLMQSIFDVEEQFRKAWADLDFLEEWINLLKTYVGRPSPLFLAERFSDAAGCTVYFKREDLNHTGAHKINNTLGQALLASRLGKQKLIAETGAGQHGLATATAAALLGMECQIYMGAEDVRRQAINVHKMKMLGATVVSVESGTRTLKDATNEALRNWVATSSDTHYIIGSAVGPHPYPWMVRAFQSVIGFEIMLQLQTLEQKADWAVACIGGGSNASGTFHPLLDSGIRLLGVEAGGYGPEPGSHGASLTWGEKGALHGSMALLLQTKSGQIQPAHSISAGLDYPGVGPEIAWWHEQGKLEVTTVSDDEAKAAFYRCTKLEGILPALESAHALAAVLRDRERFGDQTVILTMSGRGDKDVDQLLAMEDRR